jgi:hypothetical protein
MSGSAMRRRRDRALGSAARLLAGAALALSVTGLASPARAQDLSDALDLEAQGRLERALDAFESVLEHEGNSRRDLATIYEHLAVLRFAAGDEAGARDAFMRMLAVAPTASLPDAAPPEMEPIFQEVVDEWAGRSLHADVEESGFDGEDLLLEVDVVDDLLDMTGGVVVSSGSQPIDQVNGPGPSYELRVPRELLESERPRIRVRLIDEHGGAIWEGTHDLEAPVRRPRPERERAAPSTTEPEPEPDEGHGLSPRTHRILGFTLMGLGVAATAAGIALVAIDGDATGNFRGEGYLQQQEIWATAAGGAVLISLGAAAIVGGIVWVVLRRRRPAARETREAAERAAAGIVAWW